MSLSTGSNATNRETGNASGNVPAKSESPPPINLTVQLAIETTGQSGSIALLEGSKILRSTTLPEGQRTASTLAPAISSAMDWCANHKKTLHFVSVAAGPGSFTGLRIGITTAKTFCYATGLPLVAVDSLAAIAANILHDCETIDAITIGLNAFRGQTFAARFNRNDLFVPWSNQEAWTAPKTDQVLDASQWQDFIAASTSAFAGDAKVFAKVDPNRIIQRQSPDATGVGLLAIGMAARSQYSDPMQLKPSYLKVSSAEEKFAK